MDPMIYTVDMNRVGGRPAPGREPWDLRDIKRAGFVVIVSFECDRIDSDEIRAAGIEHVRICVEDFQPPTLDQLREFNELCDRKIAEGKKVLTHCSAGRGRTGTFLASSLIWRGSMTSEPVAEDRLKLLETRNTLAGAIHG